MVNLKEFEKKQLDWWCNYYRISAQDLAKRTRQFLNGEIDRGVLEATLVAIESDVVKRDSLD
tara:strand:- start:1841 stop:2026 length:186 start_codon:yes stop_codon:yes gene_type:complete